MIAISRIAEVFLNLTAPAILRPLRRTPACSGFMPFGHHWWTKRSWTGKKNAGIIASLEVAMTYTFPSRSAHVHTQVRIPATEFEPLLDSVEAAALLRIHPKTLQKLARRGEIVARHVGKVWRFRVSDLNDWLWRLERNAHGSPVL